LLLSEEMGWEFFGVFAVRELRLVVVFMLLLAIGTGYMFGFERDG
jgi:hypothetical protein